VEFLSKPRTWVVLGVLVAAGFLVQQLWEWEVERHEVQPDHFLVRVHLWGKDLPEGELLAPDESFKGVMLDVLPEGRHFVNPLFWSVETHKIVNVPPGKCGVLTRKFGKPLPPERLEKGEYLAGADERGIVPEVLLPGKHRINPHAYDYQLVDAVEVRTNEVGVRVLKWGKDPAALKGQAGRSAYVVPEGYRGVQEKYVTSGTHYVNPFVESIVPVDTQQHRVVFTDIKFPSRDGFHIQPYVLVVYKVKPEKAPELLTTLSDQGKLHQADGTPEEIQKNEILQKVVLPLIRGYVRIEGSKFDARDYISQKAGALAAGAVNPREHLHRELMTKAAPVCEKLGVVIESISLDRMEDSTELTELASQISERERTRVAREQNLKLIDQYTKEQEMKANEKVLLEQKQKVVDANTQLKVARTLAQQQKDVAQRELENDLKAAELRLEAARDQAKALLAKGKSEAAVVMAQNEAEVAPLRTAVQGFPSPDQFAQYQVVTKLAPALSEIFASDTSEFARMFAAYLTPPRAGNGGSSAMPPAGK
jgi:regulator of protease activity HflC (stomatin/prohibitin superfamily)